MRLFGRGDRQPPPPPAVAPARLPGGDRPCSERDCRRRDGLACAYVDRRGRDCPTAWCPEHLVAIDGRAYCRRHAGVLRALPPGNDGSLPDLDNRAPSLLQWVAASIEDRIVAALEAVSAPGQQLTTEPTHLTHMPVGANPRQACWERSWKLVDHRGLGRWVSIAVIDRSDEVVVRVDAAAVRRLTPPWISRRQTGSLVSTEEDARQRRRFDDEIVTAVRERLGLAGAG